MRQWCALPEAMVIKNKKLTGLDRFDFEEGKKLGKAAADALRHQLHKLKKANFLPNLKISPLKKNKIRLEGQSPCRSMGSVRMTKSAGPLH